MSASAVSKWAKSRSRSAAVTASGRFSRAPAPSSPRLAAGAGPGPGGTRHARLGRPRQPGGGPRDLVGGDLDRGGDVEGAEVGSGGDAEHRLAAVDLVVREPRALAPEHRRHRPRRGPPHELAPRFARIELHPTRGAAAGPSRPPPTRRSASASDRSSSTRARSRTSNAPAARSVASALGNRRGRTSRRSPRPMVRMARGPPAPDVARVGRGDEHDPHVREQVRPGPHVVHPRLARAMREAGGAIEWAPVPRGIHLVHPIVNVAIRAARRAGDIIPALSQPGRRPGSVPQGPGAISPPRWTGLRSARSSPPCASSIPTTASWARKAARGRARTRTR